MLNELKYNINDFNNLDEDDVIVVFRGNVYPIYVNDTSEQNIQYTINIIKEICKVYDGLSDIFFNNDGTLKDMYQENPLRLTNAFGNFEGLPKLLYGYVTEHYGEYALAFDYSMYDVANSQEFKQLLKTGILNQFSFILLNDKAYTLEQLLDGSYNNRKRDDTNITPLLYHGTTTNVIYNIMKNGLRQVKENSNFKIENKGYVYLTSVYESAYNYAKMYAMSKGGDECVIVVDTSKINKNNIVLDYDFASEYTKDIENSPYQDKIEPNSMYYKGNVAKNASNNGTKYGKIGYKGIIMPNAIRGAYVYENGSREFYDREQLLYIFRPLESKERKNNMLNEYTSRYYRDKENFNIKAYHSSRNLDDMRNIFYDGYLDPKAEHKGECPYDIIWFTIGDDYDHGFRFSFQIDQNTFNEFDFRWMNDNHLATDKKIDVMDKRLRIETINGKSIDKVYERFYDGTQNGFNEFIDNVFELSDYQLSNELFVMKILQQYGFKRSDYFMDDESQEMNENIGRDISNVIYYGLFIDEQSKQKLSLYIPDNAYKVFCDHMTIAFKNSFTDEVVEKCEEIVGNEYTLLATKIGITKDIIAIGVETDCFSVNPNKHITLCTLTPNAKPVQSNFIKKWVSLQNPIVLKGKVQAFMKNNGIRESEDKYVRQGIIPYGDGEACIGEAQLTEVEASDVNLKSFEVQDELNPRFWINNKINSRVRLKLLDLADEFYDSLAVSWVKPKDIVLTGSIANYNWSKYSDVDVHILVDYKDVWKKTEFVQDYFDSKKQLWAEEHEGLKIYGFPVEMYVEDVNNQNPNSGIYSLNKNEWIVEPNDFQDAELNEEYIKEVSAKIMTQIDETEEKLKTEKDNHKLEVLSTNMKKLFDKLHKQRKESLEKHGEMGTYNIIWKVLRRSGHLDKIWDIINNIYNKVNSIKENITKDKPKIEEAMDKNFSFEYLSSLDTEEALEYCTKELGKNVGMGSSRAVFQIDDAQVLKLALNHKGVAQNRVEASTKQMKSPLFPYILYVDDNNKWLVTEYVLPAEEDDFKHCLGMDKYDFFYDIIPDIKNLKYRGGMSAYEDEFAYYHGDSEFYRLLAKYILDYDIPIGDIERIENWGITKRNGKETLVILDPGWNKETMKLYGGWPSTT